MAAFEYLALNARGREEKGVLEADGVRQVRQLLRDKGLTPLSVNPTSRIENSRVSLLFKICLDLHYRSQRER